LINREDMLELTRRMNLQRNCFVRIAGRYCDSEGYEDGSFNTSFLKLSQHEKNVNLAIAKAIPFAKTNEELKEYRINSGEPEVKQMRQLLEGLRECGLKNDAMLEILYDIVGEKYLAWKNERDENGPSGDFGIYVFYGVYDIKIKAADHEYMDDSEEVYDFLICAVCPVHGDYEAGEPECGFLYPSFKDRSSDLEHIAVYKRL